MFVANITDSVILGIDWLEKQRAVVDLSDYSIRFNGQNILSVMINTAEHHVNIYRVKRTKKIIIPSYTKQVLIYRVNTRKKIYTKKKVKHPLIY